MKLHINANELHMPYIADNLVSRKCHKLERMLNAFHSDSLELSVEIDQEFPKKEYLAKLDLTIPDATLSARSIGYSIVPALSTAFTKLFQSVSELKASLRFAGESKKKSADFERALSGMEAPGTSIAQFAAFFSESYGRFYNYALREIRFRSYQGYTQPGTLEVNDILDEALLSAAQRLSSEFNKGEAVRLGFDEIRRTIEKYLQNDGSVPLPLSEPIEPEDIDSDYHEYYLPDEVVLVEDILPDVDAILPEQKMEYFEIETHIDKLLAQLPAEWRDVFILSMREDVPVKDIAMNRGRSEEEVLQILDQAKSFIRMKLQESGFFWSEKT